MEVERPWSLPSDLTPELIATAKEHIPAYEAALQPAKPDTVRKWLLTLGTLCAGKIGVEEARAKIEVYVALLEVSDCSLSRGSLMEAGRNFTWFPSFAEIQEFLTDKASLKRRTLARLQAIVDAKPSLQAPAPVKRWSEMSPEEKAQVEAAIGRVKAKFSASGTNGQRAVDEMEKPVSQAARDLIARGLRYSDPVIEQSNTEVGAA